MLKYLLGDLLGRPK